MLDIWRRNVDGEVAHTDEEDADCRESGGQPESDEDGEVGSVWIMGDVEELEEEEESTSRPGATFQELGK